MSGVTMADCRGAVLLMGAALGALAWVPAVQAEITPELAQVQVQAGQRFDIPAQPLASALTAFAQRTGLRLAYGAELAEGIASPGVSGEMNAQDALKRLLSGTGLTWRFTDARTVTLEKISADGAMVLDPVNVEGMVLQPTESAWGPVQGYVARRSAAGTKTDTSLIEVPQSVSVVTRDQMTARNVQEDSETLLYTPGVYAQPFGVTLSPANPFFMIRGFSSALGGSYQDGLRLETNYRVEPYGLERTEVFRGPTSTLYGQSDPGGLVHRVSKHAPEETLREIVLQGGSFERKQGAFDLGGPAEESGHVLYRLTGLLREGEAATEYDFGQDAGRNDRQFLAPTLTLRSGEGTSLDLFASYLKDDFTQEASYHTADYRLTHIRISQDDFDDYDYRHTHLGYAFEHAFDDTAKVRQNLRWTNMDYSYKTIYQDGFGPIVARDAFAFDQQVNGVVVDTQLEKTLRTGPVEQVLLAGVDYQRTEDRTSFANSWAGTAAPSLNLNAPDYSQSVTAPVKWLDSTTVGRQWGVYAQDQIKLERRWILTLSGRKDWSHSESTDELAGGTTIQDDDAFTWRAGLTHVFPSGVAPYVSYAESFLPNSGVDAAGNPFKPTTGTQYEAGVKYQPTGWRGNFAAALFDLRKQNNPTTDPANPGSRVQTGEIRSRGLELEAVAEVTADLDLNASYTYTETEITKANDGTQGNRAALAPRHMASAWADYTQPEGVFKGLEMGLGGRYVGVTWGNTANTVKNSGYVLMDAALRYDLSKLDPDLAGAKASLNATNLLGKEYYICYSSFDCAWGTPRTVMATLTYRW